MEPAGAIGLRRSGGERRARRSRARRDRVPLSLLLQIRSPAVYRSWSLLATLGSFGESNVWRRCPRRVGQNPQLATVRSWEFSPTCFHPVTCIIADAGGPASMFVNLFPGTTISLI